MNQKSEEWQKELRICAYELMELQKLYEKYSPNEKLKEDIKNEYEKLVKLINAQSYK